MAFRRRFAGGLVGHDVFAVSNGTPCNLRSAVKKTRERTFGSARPKPDDHHPSSARRVAQAPKQFVNRPKKSLIARRDLVRDRSLLRRGKLIAAKADHAPTNLSRGPVGAALCAVAKGRRIPLMSNAIVATQR